MKKVMALFPGFLLLLLLAGCQGEGKDQAPGEPNDTILKAGMIQSGKPVKMKIHPKKDVDWYGMEIPENGYVKVGVKNIPEEVKPEVRFAQKQEWESTKQKWLSDWKQPPFRFQVRDMDTLYFAVQDNFNDATSSKEFPLKADFIKEFDDHEANNSADQAKELELGKTTLSFLYPEVDEDWFKVKVDTAGYLVTRSRKSPESIKEEVRYGRKEGTSGKVKFISDHLPLPGAVRVPEKGTYYALLIDNFHDAVSRDPLKWKLEFLSEMDTLEPNNSLAEAAKVEIPDTLKAAIFPVGDNDHFKLSSEKDRKIVVKAKGKGEVKPEMRLYKKKGLEEFKAVSEWKLLPTHFSLKKDTTYYLRLHDNYDDASAEEAMEVILSEK